MLNCILFVKACYLAKGKSYYCLFTHNNHLFSGFLELELKDWMKNRAFRIVAIDHDLMSFVDTFLHDWPVILITNPKPATYMIPNHEPIARIANSTHVR